VRNDSSFERHDQMAAELGIAYGLNMWDNFDQLYPEKLDLVNSEKEAIDYIVEVWDEFNVVENMFYSPLEHDPSLERATVPKAGEDDLFVYGREVYVR
jgi:hypothetical protein